jgi:uncharacterized protein
VSILLLTAIPEEFAFRGVLLESALRCGVRGAPAWSPRRCSACDMSRRPLHTMSDNRAVAGLSASVAGQVVVVLGFRDRDVLAGLVFCWLRLRSRSLIAPVLAHFATNGLASAVAWFTVHHGRWP